MKYMILFLVLLQGCAEKKKVCGRVVAIERRLGGVALALEQKNGTVVQALGEGTYLNGMNVCEKELR